MYFYSYLIGGCIFSKIFYGEYLIVCFKKIFELLKTDFFFFLKMASKSRSNLLDVKIKENTLEEIMARAYDNFDIQLSSIQLLYSKHSKYS